MSAPDPTNAPPVTRAAITTLSAALPALIPAAVRLISGRKQAPVSVYLAIVAEARQLDLAGSAAAAYQRRFNGFYGVRRNAAWRGCFYRIFEDAKGWGEEPAALFERALTALHAETGRVEASFVSKLVATLHPQAPVIDSVVRKFLGQHINAPRFGGGIEGMVAYYAWLTQVMTALSETPSALAWRDVFDASFAAAPTNRPVHPVKCLDFLIWAGARR